MSNEDFQPRSAVKFGGKYSSREVHETSHSVKHNSDGTVHSTESSTFSRSETTSGLGGLPRIFDRKAQRADAGGKRTWLLIALAFPLVLAGFLEIFDGNAFGALRNFVLFSLVAVAAQVIRTGLIAEAEYEAREFASAPGMPRKIIGSAMLGGALLLTCWTGWGIGLIQSVGFGILGTAASIFSFGVDPMKGKGYTTSSGVTPQMVVEAIEEAEEKITGIERAGADIRDRPLRDRISRVAKRARDILLRIEQDPSDLRRAKKFLVVYLDGALEATRKYAKNQNDLGGDTNFYVKFRSLLDDMERQFDHQHEKLLKNDRIDLDVEIDVLADQLKAERAL